MSVGAWTLVAFSTAAAAAAFADFVDRTLGGSTPVRVAGNAAELLSSATGLVLTSYTGVLIGATAIPVWSASVWLLPVHFTASSVGAAASMLELAGHRDRALDALAIGAAAVETAIGWTLETRTDPALDPLRTGPSGAIVRAGALLSGPVPLVLRLLGRRSRTLRTAAALSAVAGSLLTRAGWIRAGSASAADPTIPLKQLPGEGHQELPAGLT
jgi:hypothetical protein